MLAEPALVPGTFYPVRAHVCMPEQRLDVHAQMGQLVLESGQGL